jgi:protoporphyrinogen oxidase
MADPRILIIGAGPTGLGAAWRLNELGHANWTLFEASDHPGGLASSVVDDQGFTWDLGGHVLFSHYRYFDALMATALGDAWVEHVREAWVWMRQRWIPYPFQNNIWRLPEHERDACVDGLVQLQGAGVTRPANFREWLESSFGRGLCDVFMLPYNRKVWAYDPSALDVGWMGERVATVDLARVQRNIAERRDDVGWGPNSTFRFPMHGGTGAIWRSICDRLPRERVHFQRTVTTIDLERRTVGFSDGAVERYDYLISSMPLDLLVRRVKDRPDLHEQANRFVHSSSHIVGVGLHGSPPESLRTKCWIYFPEDNVPFYRGTVFSNYSPNNVPDIRTHWSLMGEVSESPEKPVDAARVADEVVEGFVSCGFIDRGQVVSRWHRRLEHGYPTPWLGRDAVLHPIDAALREAGVFSRGRFGAWKYEVSNQDHSLMQGVEVVNYLLRGTPERTYYGDMSDEER